MDMGNITVKEILEKKLGAEKAKRILVKINESYQQGKRGVELEADVKTAIKNEGMDPGDIVAASAEVIPAF